MTKFTVVDVPSKLLLVMLTIAEIVELRGHISTDRGNMATGAP